MPAASNSQEEILLIAEKVGDTAERVERLEQERNTQSQALDAAGKVLDAAIKGLGALRSQVLESDIAKLQLALNDKARELGAEIQRFEAVAADIARRAEAADATLKESLAAEVKALTERADSLRSEWAGYRQWGDKVELSLKDHGEKLAALPPMIRGQDGRTVNPRGRYDASARYARLDIAEINGASYISTEDDNDEKPSRKSKKWVLMAARGAGGGGSTDFAGITGSITPAQLAGVSTYNIGDIFYANTTGTVTRLTPGSSGQLLSTQGNGAAPIWVTATGGAGDMNGPASATDNAIVRFDGTGGKTVQNSGVTISDTNAISVSGLSSSLTIAGTTASTNSTTGSIVTGGGIGAGGNMNAAGMSHSFGSAGGGTVTLAVNRAAGALGFLVFQTGGSDRWYAGATSAAESGSNAGTNYRIVALSDAGANIDFPLEITRAAGGTFAISRPVTMASSLVVASGVTIPAGGSTTMRLLFGSTSGPGIYCGTGAPTASAARNSLYIRDGGTTASTRLYVNTDGGTTWTNFTAAA